MATNDIKTALAQELGEATDELQIALQRASDAASRIQGLIPRVSAVNALLDEIESVIQSGRQQMGGRAALPDSFSRPTLVPTEAPQATITSAGETSVSIEPEPLPQATGSLVCFRLEFESRGGPLDLRAVDDAVGEHPAVRDVALIDYDGRKATLKVWIIDSASPSDVQESLTVRASQIFPDGADVTIVALEDAA
jgi:hypothetical protein